LAFLPLPVSRLLAFLPLPVSRLLAFLPLPVSWLLSCLSLLISWLLVFLLTVLRLCPLCRAASRKCHDQQAAAQQTHYFSTHFHWLSFLSVFLNTLLLLICKSVNMTVIL
jgi:hypothetical protein